MNEIIEHISSIDEIIDVINLWPDLCIIFENTFKWPPFASAVISGFIALIIVATPAVIIGALTTWIIKQIRNL